MFSEQKMQEMIDLYNTGKTQKEIAILIGCTQTGVSAVLRRKNITTRVGKKIVYTDINIQFFQEINSENSAYFLGLLYADGNVQTNNNNYCMTLKLKSNDQYIIENFRDIMSPSSPIKITRNKKSSNTYSYFRINQKEICEQLVSHGCVPNKSLILEFPITVPKEFIRHFLRGYSDGDGTIYKNQFKKKKTINTIWKIVSTKQFCNETSKLLKDELNITCSKSLCKPKTNQITTSLSVGGNLQVRQVLDWLYKDATIYLPRKYEKYQEFIEYQKQKSQATE
jgi:intein-encoded DNA endonuclease-like protein